VAGIYNRLVKKPERYEVPPKYGKAHTFEAIFVLLMISGLMISDALYEGSLASAAMKREMETAFLFPGTLHWIFAHGLRGVSLDALQSIHVGFYFVHELIFFTFLNFLPLGKHFHVITSLFNVFLAKTEKGSVKPVQWGLDEDGIVDLEAFGVKYYEDFTWKHILDFYSCADCGRCSDNCPATAVGRPLSPRFISIKCRDYSFDAYPLRGEFKKSRPLIGTALEEDEIWSCTTCGACEQECPLLIEYIDKVVDVRRGMVDEGNVPQSLQKPLGALEKRGNPYGKTEKKRIDWIKDIKEDYPVKVLGKKETAPTLFFVDSATSYDDRLQEIARSGARVLARAGIDFGILGPEEKDSGHEVRRFGEEMLFMELRDRNTEAILGSGVSDIVTADPHAFNALLKDYKGLPPVRHICQLIAECIENNLIRFNGSNGDGKVYTYHDPCYLGRHNELYDVPRQVIDAIPGIRRIEMDRCRDRSFCCGGGGLMLFYEPIEETRMGKIRVEMAREAGADVIVTACPFCMINIEDAIKTSGLEGKMEAVDLVELVDRQMIG
jgi:Fe-S oxidoreductase